MDAVLERQVRAVPQQLDVIDPAIRRAGGEVRFTDLFVVHAGSEYTPEARRGKLERDSRILALDLAERPEHPFVLFNLGMTCADAGRHAEAAGYLRRSIAAAGPRESHLRKAYALLAGSLSAAGQAEEAQAACEEGLERFPGDIELLFRWGVLHQSAGRLEGPRRPTRRCWRPALLAGRGTLPAWTAHWRA